MTDETPEISPRDRFLVGLASGAALMRGEAVALLSGYMAGRMCSLEDVLATEDPVELGKHLRSYAAAEVAKGSNLEAGEDKPALPASAFYRVEVEFRAPLSSGLAVTTALVQVALPKAWRRKVSIDRVSISTGDQRVQAQLGGEGE